MTKKRFPVTQQQRDNLLDALNNLWPSVPPENVVRRLAVFRSDRRLDGTTVARYEDQPDCNTLACFGGWCVAWPNFMAQGLYSSLGAPIMLGGGVSADEQLFGVAGLFSVRGCFGEDLRFGAVSDHEVVTHRLKWAIDNSVVVDNP